MNTSKLFVAIFSAIIGMFASQIYIAVMMYMADDKKQIFFFHKVFAVLLIISVGTLVYAIFMAAVNIQHLTKNLNNDV